MRRPCGALSEFDAEMVKLFRGMERLVVAEDRGEPVAVNTYVRGDLIERWMLKTLINGLFSGNFPVPFVDSFKGQLPPDESLQVIYRNVPLARGAGMYFSHALSRVDHHVFRLEAVGEPAGIVGLRMRVFGSVISLVLKVEVGAFPEIATATYRPRKIVAAKTRNGVVLSWPGEYTDATLELHLSGALK